MEDNLQTVFLSYPGSRDERLYTVLNEALAQLPEARVIDWPQFEKGEFIGPKIFEKIRESSLVVAVLNDETHRINENVLVEFGAAFALQRPVLPIVEKRALASVPFNLRDVALLEYDDRDLVTEQGRTEFRAQLTGCLRDHIERLLTTSQTGGEASRPVPRHRRELIAAQAEIQVAYAPLRAVGGLNRETSRACAEVRALSRDGRREQAVATAWRLVRRLRSVAHLHDDAGFLLWRCILGFVCLLPVLWAVLQLLPRVLSQPARIAHMPVEQVFVGVVYALGPMLLAVPVAHRLGRLPGGIRLAGWAPMLLFAVWGTASFLLVQNGWASVANWQVEVDTQQMLARGALLGFLFSATVTLSLRRAGVTLRAALGNTARAAGLAVVSFVALRLAVVFVVEPQMFGAQVPTPAVFAQETAFGLIILVAFIVSVVLSTQLPWLGYRSVEHHDAAPPGEDGAADNGKDATAPAAAVTDHRRVA